MKRPLKQIPSDWLPPSNWLPTCSSINALPDPVRIYVHDLETNADPAGMVMENTLLADQIERCHEYITLLKRREKPESYFVMGLLSI